MENALEELNRVLEVYKYDLDDIKCARIIHSEEMYVSKENSTHFVELKASHSQSELREFLNSLNYEYDSGFGAQELYGIVWLKDGNWLDRWEYDGLEGWQLQKCPEIPEELL